MNPRSIAAAAALGLLAGGAAQAQLNVVKVGPIRYTTDSRTNGVSGPGIPPGADAETGDDAALGRGPNNAPRHLGPIGHDPVARGRQLGERFGVGLRFIGDDQLAIPFRQNAAFNLGVGPGVICLQNLELRHVTSLGGAIVDREGPRVCTRGY